MGHDREPGVAERCFNRIPMYMSYVILGLTWIGFIGIVSIHSTLIKREEYLHFFIQQIVYNSLSGLTVLSLFFASTRNPGQPSPDLAPPGAAPPPEMEEVNRTFNRSRRHQRHSRTARPPPFVSTDPDDIPLRFLRNTQWVSSRIGKDRPSPLPLRSTRQASGFPDPDSLGESSASSVGQPVSPFPIMANPLVPHNAAQAGEDEVERREDQQTAQTVEGEARDPVDSASYEEGENEEGSAQDPLLQSFSGSGRKSIMAKSNDGTPRWCKKCDAWKPDRTHHCRFCQRCTLKMDHHCIWLGTCVGFHNYKPFLLFITYGTSLALYATLEAGYEAFRFFQDPDDFLASAHTPQTSLNGTCVGESCTAIPNAYTSSDEMLDPSPIVSICLMIIGGVFTLAVGSLAGYHWWLVCNNMTTLENISFSYPSVLLEAPATSGSKQNRRTTWKPDHLLTRDERNRLRREARDINVYDIGLKGNVRSIFGDRSKFLAFWPTVRAYRRHDAEAGHFFDVDDEKLERLRELTRELRYGKDTLDSSSGFETESEGSDVDNDDDDGVHEAWEDEPRTGSSGGRGDDEMTDVDLSSTLSKQKRSVPWFEQ